MSLSVEPLKSFRVKDPRIDISEEKAYTIFQGGDTNTYRPTGTVSLSNDSVNFNAPPPSPLTIVNRKVYIKLYADMVFVGPATNTSNVIGYVPIVPIPPGSSTTNWTSTGTDSLRAYPISSTTNTLQVGINGVSKTQFLSEFMPTLLRFNTYQNEQNFDYSTTPNLPDQSQNYSDVFPSIRNPLASYQSSDEYTESRGSFPIEIMSISNIGAVIRVVITEPLFISPLTFGSGDQVGFTGVTNFDVNMTMGNLSRMWSHDAVNGQVISSISVNLTRAELLFDYITAPLLTEFPKGGAVYSLFDIQRYNTDDAPTGRAPGVPFQINGNNIQVNVIPERIYIFARRSNATRNFNNTDTYATIESVSINWDNVSGLLAGASKQDLYLMSVKNGLKMSWSQWDKWCGSILCCEFGADIGLKSDIQSPGLLGTYQLQVNANFKNTNTTDTIVYQMFVVIVSGGLFTIYSGGSAISQLGVISQQEILNAKNLPTVYKNPNGLKSIYGGDFLSGLKSFFGKVKSGFEKAKPYLTAVADVAKDTPYGSITEAIRKPLGVGRKRRGGQLISRDELREGLY